MVRLSILYSAYNSVKFKDRFIQNISALDFDDYEVICVVDSRSTDDSVRVFQEEFSKHDNWKVVIQNGDGRLGEARNLGLEEAVGDYIWCCDMDDCFSPTMPREMIQLMEAYNADIVRCNYARVPMSTFDGTLPSIPEKEFVVHVMSRDEALHERFEERLTLTSWSMIFSRRFIDEGLRFTTGGIAEDDFFTVLTLSRAKTVCYTEKPLYVYLFDDRSDWRSSSFAEQKKAVYDKLIKDFEDRQDPMINELRSFAVRLILHEAILKNRDDFLKFTRSSEFLPEFRKYCKKNLLEKMLFLYFPKLYYKMARKRLVAEKVEEPYFLNV